MTDAPRRGWLGLAVVTAGVLALIEAGLGGATFAAAVVGGGTVAALLLVVVAGYRMLLGSARALMPAPWRRSMIPEATIVAVLVALVALLALASVIAARHHDPAMIAATVAILGSIAMCSTIAVVVPLAARLAVRLRLSTPRIRRPAWVDASSRAATVTAAIWAVGSMTALTVAEAMPLRGHLAIGAGQLLDTITDFERRRARARRCWPGPRPFSPAAKPGSRR